jgi:hypothetical protein
MICSTRPRRPLVSDEAPMTATERGHSSFPMSGTKVFSGRDDVLPLGDFHQ